MTCACPVCGHDLPPHEALTFDPDSGTVMRNGHAVTLPGRQAQMFGLVYSAYPRTVSKGALMDGIYGLHAEEPGLKILAVLACHINKKLRPLGIRIDTIWARGHRLNLEA